MDVSVIWSAAGAIGTFAAAGIAAWASRQSRESARHANAAADALAATEQDRRYVELTPQFRITGEPWAPGGRSLLRLRLLLTGPPDVEYLDTIRLGIRNDFHRWPGPIEGLTAEQISAHIWGPWQFRLDTGQDDPALSSADGRVIEYHGDMRLGEELICQLVPTTPAPWMTGTTQEQWQAERGNVIRLGIVAEYFRRGRWSLAAEIELPTSLHWRGMVQNFA